MEKPWAGGFGSLPRQRSSISRRRPCISCAAAPSPRRRFRPDPCIFSCPIPLGDVVSKQWGQSVVVENRPGAGGVIASQAVATAPPDGYTLIMVASGHATNPLLYSKIPYDTFKDFTPVSLLAISCWCGPILLSRRWQR